MHSLRFSLAALALSCLLVVRGLAADTPAPAPAPVPAPAPAAAPAAKGPPTEVKIGAYVESLYDLNPNNNTFAADFWLWALHDKNRDLKPLKTIEPENARTWSTSLDATEEHPPLRYHAVRVRGVFAYNWDIENFPFDRHELRVRLSESQAEAAEILYKADTANTGFEPAIRLEGWQIDKVAFTAGTHTYNTTYGEPESTGSSTYAQGVLSIFVSRDSMGLFWKLHAAVYIAFLVSMVSFFMDTSKDGIFNGRVSLLVGMMFAVVVNTARVASTLGQNSAFTLADKIHVLTLFELLVALVCALISRRLQTSGQAKKAEYIDRRMAAGTAIAYVIANTVLVALAAHGS